MERYLWVAHSIKQGLAEASQQYGQNHVFQSQGEGRKEEGLIRACSQLRNWSVRMGAMYPSSEWEGLYRTRLVFILCLRGLNRWASSCCFWNGAAFLLLPKRRWYHLGSHRSWVFYGWVTDRESSSPNSQLLLTECKKINFLLIEEICPPFLKELCKMITILAFVVQEEAIFFFFWC